jgi:tetratricopeptide (TPR) repeat protein
LPQNFVTQSTVVIATKMFSPTRTFAHLFGAGLILLILTSPTAAARAKDNWIRVRTNNFLLVGNASEKEIREVAVRLEQFRDGFTRLLTGFRFNSAASTTVLVFKSNDTFDPYKPVYQGKKNNVAGYFQSGEDVNYITLTTEQLSEDPYQTIFHEYVHLLLHNTVRNVPPWFDEGLAEYYRTFDVSDGGRKVLLGKPIPAHLRMLRSEPLLPLQTLVNVDRKSPYYNEGDKTGIFYAQSWALVHYLILGGDRRRQQQIGTFLELLRDGAKPDKAFQQAFNADYETLGFELKAYLSRPTFRMQVVSLPERLPDRSDFDCVQISEGEARAYLGDLLLHIDRLDEASAMLEQALALDPKLALARASLGLVRVRQKRYGDAIVQLRKAEAIDPDNFLTHYYHAFALSRSVMDDSLTVSDYAPQIADVMREELRRAIELNPAFPESYVLLAFINLTREQQLDESIQLVRHALSLAPGRDDYVFVLAQLYMRKQDFNTARQVLQPMLREGADETIRQSGITLLNSMNKIEQQLQRLRAATKSDEDEQGDEVNRKEPSLEMFLRKPQKGEQRVQGFLDRVDCTPGTILFFVDATGHRLTLHASRLERVRFVTYTEGIGREMTCGQRRPPNSVIVTYLPGKDPRMRSDGEMVAVEFVPPGFQLQNP